VSADLWKLDATAQAALVRGRQVSPRELLESAIARVEALNPSINAVVTPLYNEGRARADGVDDASPFAGVPMLFKDANLEIEGTPYYVGTRVLRELGYRSTRTRELASRLLRAGVVPFGKTNCPALSSGVTTEPLAFGPTRNPWNLERSAGGSSGGSAAAVAAGLASVASGGDATGSLRNPAGCCGVATLKPSRGRLPSESPLGDGLGAEVWVDFVLTRSVRDLAAMLDAVLIATAAGPPPPRRPFVQELRDPGRALRIGLLPHDAMANIPTDDECRDAVRATGAVLETLGHHVEEAHPAALDGLFLRTAAAMRRVTSRRDFSFLERIAGRPVTSEDLEPRFFEPVEACTDAEFAVANDEIMRESAAICGWWDDGWDVLVTPTNRQPAWRLGSDKGALDAGVFPAPFSFSGQPAMSLPLAQSRDGLPVGLQIVAAQGREDLLFNVAWQLEQAMPWADRWPPIAATGPG
jgi:amidase